MLEGAYGKITLELTIYEVQPSDFGVYECRAANSFGMGYANVALAGMNTIHDLFLRH